jgi:hypothetical protein
VADTARGTTRNRLQQRIDPASGGEGSLIHRAVDTVLYVAARHFSFMPVIDGAARVRDLTGHTGLDIPIRGDRQGIPRQFLQASRSPSCAPATPTESFLPP